MEAHIIGPASSPGQLLHSRHIASLNSRPRHGSTSSHSQASSTFGRYLAPFDPNGSDPTSDEELVWYDRTVVWSRGAEIYRQFTFDAEGENVARAVFVWFKVGEDQHRQTTSESLTDNDSSETFGPFHTSQHARWGAPKASSSRRPNPPRLERTLVVFLQSRAHVYYQSGEDVIVHLPFVVDGAWALDEGGVMVQRALEKRELRKFGRGKGKAPKNVLRGMMDQTSMTILDDLLDLEDENAPSLPRLYTLEHPFDELKMIVEGKIEGGWADDHLPPRLVSPSSSVTSASTLLFISPDPYPFVVLHDRTAGAINFCRRARAPPMPEPPPAPTNPRTMRPEDILRPPDPPNKRPPRPSLHRNSSSIGPVVDRRLSGAADPFDRSQRRHPRLSRGPEPEGRTDELQATLEPLPFNTPAIGAPAKGKTRDRGLSTATAVSEGNSRTSGAFSFVRQNMTVPLGKMALNTAGDDDLRETTMMMGLEKAEKGSRSDIVLERFWSWQLPGEVDPSRIKVYLSENRSPSSVVINLHFATSTHAAHLYTFHVQQKRHPDAQFQVTPFQSFSCCSAIPLLSTRKSIFDVLVLSHEGQVELLSSSDRSLPIQIPHKGTDGRDEVATKLASSLSMGILDDAALKSSHRQKRIVDVIDPSGSAFTVVFEDQEKVRISADFRIRHPLTRQCMEALSLVLPAQEYYLLTREVLLAIQQLPSVRRMEGDSLWKAFIETLGEILGFPASTPVTMTWDSLRAQAANSPDPLVARLANSELLSAGKRRTAVPPTTLSPRSNERIASVYVAPSILALHLVAQDSRLKSSRRDDVRMLADVLVNLCGGIGKNNWKDYWMRIVPNESVFSLKRESVDTAVLDAFQSPPDILSYLGRRLITPTTSFPNLYPSPVLDSLSERGSLSPFQLTDQVCKVYDLLGPTGTAVDPKHRSASIVSRAADTILWMVDQRLDQEWIENLSHGVAVPILEMIKVCQYCPDKNWSAEVYRFIDRSDLCAQVSGEILTTPEAPREDVSSPVETFPDLQSDAAENPFIGDLMASIDGEAVANKDVQASFSHVRFGSDREESAADVADQISEQEIIQYHQNVVNTISNRTLAVLVGQGIFEYGTQSTAINDVWHIPLIELSVKIIPGNSVLKAQISTEVGDWPCFHNGVSRGLSISPDCKGIDSSWIVFNRPTTLNPQHGGFLLGLGLTGHLRSLMNYHAFPYLEPRDDFISVGLLLGLASSYAGSQDLLITKVLSLHTHALLPMGSMELNASPIIQSTALVGLGLVYVGSKNIRMAESSLSEVGRTEMAGVDNFVDNQEAYSFSASMAFGLIMLGRGGKVSSEVDRRMLSHLRRCILGDNPSVDPTLSKSRPKIIDPTVTAPGATLALGFMYLKTGRKDIADMIAIPETALALEQIRPDLLLLRTFARCLILWEHITPTMDWIESHLPPFIQQAHKSHKKSSSMELTAELAYFNILAGACLAIGLKYAGTATELAHNNLLFFFGVLGKAAASQSMTYEGRIRRNAARQALSVATIALATVMSGTGELNVLRRLRVSHGQEGSGINYGTHMAMHMALGILFLGKGHYTLGNSNLAIAAMSIAFFPRFLSSPTDNKAYPQAFRHLWALAVEPRCLIARDVDTKETVYLPVKVKQKGGNRPQNLISPTLIAPFDTLVSIEVDSPRYWPISYDLSNQRDRDNLVKTRTIYVKRKAGFLDYNTDPKGNRSIFVRAGSMTGFDLHYDLLSQASPPGVPAIEVVDLVKAHSGKPSLMAMAERFSTSNTLDSFVRTVLLECVSLDKPALLGTYLAILSSMNDRENIVEGINQLALLKDFYSSAVFEKHYMIPSPSGDKRFVLVRPSFLAASYQSIGSYIRPAQDVLESYFKRQAWGTEDDIALATYLVRNTVPPPELLVALGRLVGDRNDDDEVILEMKVRESAGKYMAALRGEWDGARLGLPREIDYWKAGSASEAVGVWRRSV
ncbi:anaphase-promoting complex subunit 1, partial [Tremellales sp. Uapishka_1]